LHFCPFKKWILVLKSQSFHDEYNKRQENDEPAAMTIELFERNRSRAILESASI
jgi:hypothetical protein